MALILYSTEGCHLCDDALALFRQLNIHTAIEQVDVADDDLLFSRYGIRIPVISWQKNAEMSVELAWPFDLSQLQTWLVEHGID